MSTHSRKLPRAALLKKFAVGWLWTSLLILFASPSGGQTAQKSQAAPASEATEQTPSVSTIVDEVSLDLAVHDRSHNAILDLKPDQIVVTDDGAPVKLTGFRLITGEAAANRSQMITLVFDTFRGTTAKSTRNIAEKILALLPGKGTSFAVLDFGGCLRLIQGFTDDRKAVDDAIHLVTESEAIALTSTLSLAVNIVHDEKADEARATAAAGTEKNLIAIAQTGVDLSGRAVEMKQRARAQTLLAALQDTQAIALAQHTQLNLAGLLALVKSQQRLGDRKTLIYFTQNQQLNAAAKQMLKTIAEEATRADVSLYVVDMDASGNSSRFQMDNALLNGQAPYDPAATVPVKLKNGDTVMQAPPQQQSAVPLGSGSQSGGMLNWGPAQDIAMATDFMRGNNEDRSNPFNDTKSPMAGLAKATGGAYIDALANIRKALEQMAQDLTTYYQASYVPPFKEYDGKFRTIAVKPLRASLDIQTRTGYFALAPGAEAGIRPFEAPLLKALAAPELPSEIEFHATVLRFGDLPDGNTNTLAVEVPLSALQTKVEVPGNPPSAHVSIVAQIKDPSGVVVEHYAEDILKRGIREELDRDRSAAISLSRHFITAPGKYTMEVGVLDQNSGKAGVERSSFEIPELSGVISLSDMVVVRKMDQAHGEDEDPFEPLRYEHQKVTPDLAAELPADAKDVSLFFLLHPDPALKDATTLEMEVVHNGKAGRRTPLLETDGVHAAIPYLASLGSGALSPGKYEVRAYLSQGGKTTTQSATFSVAGTPGAEAADSPGLGNAGAVIGLDEGSPAPGAAPHAEGQLAITPLTSAVPALSKDEAHLLIESARQHALDYNELLPNLICTEVTNRSVDLNGDGKWRLRDTFVESLRYREKNETRTMLEVNGKASSAAREAMKGALSAGEFGGVLQAVFRDASKADFQWKETAALKGGTVQVYDYRVGRSNSIFSVTASNGKQLMVGFHGQVFIDSAARRARRITLIADDLPPDFPTHATSIGVDYDYVPINGLQYLLPVSAELQLKQGQRQIVMNTMEFKDYERLNSR
jgi:VWFA-related protein